MNYVILFTGFIALGLGVGTKIHFISIGGLKAGATAPVEMPSFAFLVKM